MDRADSREQSLFEELEKLQAELSRLANGERSAELERHLAQIETVRQALEDVARERAVRDQHLARQTEDLISRLSGSIAQRYKDILYAIIGHAEMARETLEPEHPIREDLAEILQAAMRSVSLTQQLLAFGRRHLLRPENVDLNEMVTHSTEMLARVLGDEIEIVADLCRETGAVFADPGLIEQVLFNLCLNAREAMSKGGQITIETRNEIVDELYLEAHPWAQLGSFAVLSVTDSGAGMEPEMLAHIFEPFFSTKEETSEAGLGLATVHGTVRQHGGLIHVYSEPEVGTSFKIFLPLSTPPAGHRRPVSQSTPGGTETILLGESDPLVRQVVARVLTRAGYTVQVATDGPSAAGIFEADPDGIQLVLLDLVMPGLRGPAVYERIAASRPDVKVLFTSGFAQSIGDEIFRNRYVPLIPKPYHPSDLLRKVRGVIDGPEE